MAFADGVGADHSAPTGLSHSRGHREALRLRALLEVWCRELAAEHGGQGDGETETLLESQMLVGEEGAEGCCDER